MKETENVGSFIPPGGKNKVSQICSSYHDFNVIFRAPKWSEVRSEWDFWWSKPCWPILSWTLMGHWKRNSSDLCSLWPNRTWGNIWSCARRDFGKKFNFQWAPNPRITKKIGFQWDDPQLSNPINNSLKTNLKTEISKLNLENKGKIDSNELWVNQEMCGTLKSYILTQLRDTCGRSSSELSPASWKTIYYRRKTRNEESSWNIKALQWKSVWQSKNAPDRKWAAHLICVMPSQPSPSPRQLKSSFPGASQRSFHGITEQGEGGRVPQLPTVH